jgi:GNAT superfamily N-acetyltransferase
MLPFAASMQKNGMEQISFVKSDPYLAAYVADWKAREGDIGVIARDNSGKVLGATWLRLARAEGRFDLCNKVVPELAIAVVPEARGIGVGKALMNHLIELAKPLFRKIILSVRVQNPAVYFYSQLGFSEISTIKNRVGGSSIVMALDL